MKDTPFNVLGYIYVVRIKMKNGPILGKYDDIEFKDEKKFEEYKNRIHDTEEYVDSYRKAILVK